MEIVAQIADITGILSFLIGILTFITTLRIRSKIRANLEKSDYIKEIDNHVNDLKSYYDTMIKDELYTSELLDTIDVTLDDIQILYGSILPKKLSGQIRKLRNFIKNSCQKNLSDKKAKIDCAKQIHTIASKLAKEKRVLWQSI